MREDQIDRLHRKFGKNTNIFLTALAKGKQFKQAIDTPIGKILLDDATNHLEGLVEKVINEISTPEERAEIRALKKIVNRWATKINEFQAKQTEFNKVIGD